MRELENERRSDLKNTDLWQGANTQVRATMQQKQRYLIDNGTWGSEGVPVDDVMKLWRQMLPASIISDHLQPRGINEASFVWHSREFWNE